MLDIHDRQRKETTEKKSLIVLCNENFMSKNPPTITVFLFLPRTRKRYSCHLTYIFKVCSLDRNLDTNILQHIKQSSYKIYPSCHYSLFLALLSP